MKRNYILIWLLAISFIARSQEREINGSVFAFNKYPLKNVKVIAKKSKQEVLTDENGKFGIIVKKNDVLNIEAKSFEGYRYKVKDDDKEIRVNLIFNNPQQNKELVIKEGYMNREDLEYGITHLMDENNIYSNFIDVFDAIRYKIPAAQIINVGGQKQVQLRGQKSIEGGPTTVLFIVNGIPNEDISFINPIEIISIKQLTSGQAAIYGARAGGGVIAITTK